MKPIVRFLMIGWIVLMIGSVFGQTVTINQAVLTSSNQQVETAIAFNSTSENNF